MKLLIDQARQIDQLNDDLNHAEASLREIIESCDGWMNSQIQEPSYEFIKGIQMWIKKRHPHLNVEGLEF